MDINSEDKISCFQKYSECQHLLVHCNIGIRQDKIIIDCPNIANATFLWKSRQGLISAAVLVGLYKEILLNVGGEAFDIIPTHANTHNMQIIKTGKTQNFQSSAHQALLDLVRYSEHATYVTLLPSNWEWGMPITCVLTSEKVGKFSSRPAFDFHKKVNNFLLALLLIFTVKILQDFMSKINYSR